MPGKAGQALPGKAGQALSRRDSGGQPHPIKRSGPRRRGNAPLTVLAATLLLAVGNAVALPEDREQPIHITANKALRDEKQGFTVYEGQVRMQQGSLRIAARRITVFHQVEEADRILAEGNPARMQQQPEANEALMKARADTIEYFKGEERVLLRSNATIEQDGSKVTGESIEYFIDKQLIRADSGEKQVEVTIEAGNLSGRESDSGNSAPPEQADTEASQPSDPNQPVAKEAEAVEEEAERGATDSE